MGKINVSKDAVVKIIVQKSVLKADVIEKNGDIFVYGDSNSVNAVLRSIYEKEDITLGDLIRSGRVVIDSDKVWDNYEVVGDAYFVKRTDVKEKEEKEKEAKALKEKAEREKAEREKAEREKAEREGREKAAREKAEKEAREKAAKEKTKEKGSSSEDDDSKKRIRLTHINKKAIAWTLFGIFGIACIYTWVKGKTGNNTVNTNTTNTRYEDSNNTYTGNSNSYVSQTTGKTVTYTEPETPEYDTYDYSSLGSSIVSEDMETQLSSIERITNKNMNKTYNFENLVIDDDYNTVKIFSDMRNKVITGNCSPEDFVECMVKYINEGGEYIDGCPVERFYSLYPYSRFIIARGTQGILTKCPGYNRDGYNFEAVATLVDPIGNDTYVLLVNSRHK